MALELKRAQQSLHKTTAEIPVGSPDGEVAIEAVDIWFRPITANLLNELEVSGAGESLAVIEAKALWLSKILARWAITEGGSEIEPTLDALKTLNQLQLDAMIEAISVYTYPKKTT